MDELLSLFIIIFCHHYCGYGTTISNVLWLFCDNFYDLLCCCWYSSYRPYPNPFTFTIVLSGTMSWRNFYSFIFAGINNFFRSINNNSEWQFTSQMHFMDSRMNFVVGLRVIAASIVCPINFHRAKTFFVELVKIFIFSSSTSILVVRSYFISWCEPQKH